MAKKSIGTRNESSLHRALKFRYAGPGGKTEVKVGEYVADGIRQNGEYIEVQTGSFSPLKKKVKELTNHGKARIIHPIAVNKYIEVYSPGSPANDPGKLLYRRKSPVHGSSWNIFDALISAPELPLTKGVTIEIVLVEITEKRIKDGKGSWRRKGISIFDKELSVWHESIVFSKPKDYLQFIPFKKGEEFTVSSFAKQANVNISIAGKALYALTKMKLLKKIGKKKRAWVYARVV